MTQLHLDLHAATEYLQTPWSYGVGVRSAASLSRKDVQRHLLLARDECGFRHVRFPGIFDDAMAVVKSDGTYDFAQIEQVLDWLMEQGLLPYIELGDGPQPQDVALDLARALAAFIDGRYGCDTEEWHFSVTSPVATPAVATSAVATTPVTPPDTALAPGSPQAACFDLYDRTARAVKSVNGRLKVGGPGTNDLSLVDAFLTHVSTPSEAFGLEGQRCDYLSVAGPAEGQLQDWPSFVNGARQRLTTVLGETFPLIVSAWGSTGVSAASSSADACVGGAFAAAVAAGMTYRVEGAIYDCLTDIDQSADTPPLYEPFHGGVGLLTVNDVRKASFNALKLLNEHNGFHVGWEWKDATPGLTAVVTRDYHNVVRIVASYSPPVGSAMTGPAKFTIEGLPESVQWGQVQVLRPSHGSPFEAWQEQGKPRFVNRYLLDDLEAASHPATAEVNFKDYPPRLEPGMTLQLTIPLPEDALSQD